MISFEVSSEISLEILEFFRGFLGNSLQGRFLQFIFPSFTTDRNAFKSVELFFKDYLQRFIHLYLLSRIPVGISSEIRAGIQL